MTTQLVSGIAELNHCRRAVDDTDTDPQSTTVTPIKAGATRRLDDKPCRRRELGRVVLLFGVLLTGALPTSARAAEPAPEILAFGDSISAGLGLPADQAFPARLGAKLKEDGLPVRVVNAGVSGDTTAGGVARLDWALADKPAIVLLELGANDALRGIDPTVVRSNLEKMIQKIQANGAKLVILGMQAPPNWGQDYQREFDRIYPELAQAHNVPLYPFVLEGVAMNPQLNQPDGLHPNERGVAVMVDRIAPLVAPLVSQFEGGRS
jgi:acyl-CoA thioesterase-1